MNHSILKWGRALSTMASTLLLVASSERVGAAIQRQWIKTLRTIANEMEKELATHGKSSRSKE